MGVHSTMTNTKTDTKHGMRDDYGVKVASRLMDTPSPEAEAFPGLDGGIVQEWIEMWDYVGGVRFRGFVAASPSTSERAMFIFFDDTVIGNSDLKAG
jgi:hypothetical protein